MVKIRSRTDIQNSEFTIASWTTTDLSTTYSNRILVTGTTTITSFGTVSADTPDFVLRFSGSLTITHNSTTLILPQGRNIITNVGDTIVLQSLWSGNWRCVAYFREDWSALSSNESNSFSVRVATTTAGTLATGFENGDIIDWVTLVTGDVILIKDQSSGSENGIYTVNASGSPTRVYYYNDDRSIRRSVVFSREWTINSGKSFANTNTSAITVWSTALTYALQVPSSTWSTFTAGENIAAWDIVCLNRPTVDPYARPLVGNVLFGDSSPQTQRGSQFVPSANISGYSIDVWICKTWTPVASNVIIEIQTNNAGLPSWTVVTNATATLLTTQVPPTDFARISIPFAWLVSLTSWTTYHVVAKHDWTITAANEFRLMSTTSTNNGSTNNSWSWVEQNTPFGFVFNWVVSWSVLKASSSAFETNEPIGIATETKTSWNSVFVLTSGIYENFSWLTPWSTYYLSATPWAISTSPQNRTVIIGRATSTSSLDFVKKNYPIQSDRPVHITPWASPFTFTNTFWFPIRVNVSLGTVSSIIYSKWWATLLTWLTAWFFDVSVNDSLVITYSSVPLIRYFYS